MENKTKLRKCKYCGSEIKINPGLHNWKNLFRKPRFEDYMTLFLIFMIIISSYAYKSDLKSIIEYYENESYCNIKNNLQPHQTDNLINSLLNNSVNISYSSDSKEDG